MLRFCEHSVQRWEHDQRQQGRADESADDDHGERTLNFRSDAVRKRQRNQTQHRDQRRHQHGAQAKEAASHDCLVIGQAFSPKLIDVGHEHDAVEHRHTEQVNESH